jgi:hypothetical protein
LKQTVISHFYNKSSCDINEDTFNNYLSLTSNNDDKKLINNLLNDTRLVRKNKSISNFVVKDYNDISRRIKDIIKNKNSLLFFWNPEFVSESYIASRIDYLTNKYPNIQFVEIKIDGKSTSHIRNIDIKNQFYLDANSTAHSFLSSKLPRSILVDHNGLVINGYASISSKNVQPYLASLQK